MEQQYYVHTVAVKLHNFFIEKIKAYASVNSTSMSDVVRKAILDYIENTKPIISSRVKLLIDGKQDSRRIFAFKISDDLYEKLKDFALKHNTRISSIVISALYYKFVDNTGDNVKIVVPEKKKSMPFVVCPICNLYIQRSGFAKHLRAHSANGKRNYFMKYRDIIILSQEAALQGDKEAIRSLLSFVRENYGLTVFRFMRNRTKQLYYVFLNFFPE